MSLGVIGHDGCGPVIAGEGFTQFSEALDRDPKVVVSLGKFAIECHAVR
jgi:hypothetical protein